MLLAWANLVHDPGKVAADWVRHTAPAGVLSCFTVSSLWRGWNDEGVVEPEDLVADVEVFRNSAGMDVDENVFSRVHEFVEKGFLKAFDSPSNSKEYLGGTPVLSRFGQVAI